ncbi:ankyrin repeat-containing domain protein [Dunaliella salina]|uniref:Ankyrin repeat-containing domain protein n=1 Tax=Dunaliella salina TaxID=3046 RepID=A0ABQ7GXM1_DUNSA|nr:ankyrin repeat-containing domain protein [Dunaliella salina]|eukprot:KAF5839365.1 ankyrin repeat-containing domain protein [Dunaliella salina]
MEKHPWFLDLDESVLPRWDRKALEGCKPEGGGCIRGQGRVGPMRLWRAVNNRKAEEVRRLVEQGDSPNEVEAAGNTPLHAAAYQGWVEGIDLLLQLGAKVNASNNAGDTPYHTALYMGNEEAMLALEKAGASKASGKVLVQEHVPKVKEFYQKECWSHHPLPYSDFVEYKKEERKALEKARQFVIRD